MIDEIVPRATDRPSDLTLCSVWYMGGATSRVAADATAFGDRGMGWMLSIDAIWRRSRRRREKPRLGARASGPT